MDELAAGVIGSEPKLAARHAHALDRFLLLGGGDLDARAGAVCAEVGLSVPLDAAARGVVGEARRARAQLAAALLCRASTSFCSTSRRTISISRGSIAWRQFREEPLRGPVVVVSRDRDFLDRTVERVDRAGRVDASRARVRRRLDRVRASRAARVAPAGGGTTAPTEGEKARLEEQLRRMQQWEERGYGQGRRRRRPRT